MSKNPPPLPSDLLPSGAHALLAADVLNHLVFLADSAWRVLCDLEEGAALEGSLSCEEIQQATKKVGSYCRGISRLAETGANLIEGIERSEQSGALLPIGLARQLEALEQAARARRSARSTNAKNLGVVGVGR